MRALQEPGRGTVRHPHPAPGISAKELFRGPYTPALPMLYGLRESLAMLFEEGLEHVFARHHRLAEGTRAAV